MLLCIIHKETLEFHWFRLQLHFSQTVCCISSHSSGVIFRLSNAINFKRIHCPNLQFNFRSKEHEIFSLYVHRSWSGSFLDLVSFQIAALSIPSVCVCECHLLYNIFRLNSTQTRILWHGNSQRESKTKEMRMLAFFSHSFILQSFSLHTKRKQAMLVCWKQQKKNNLKNHVRKAK